VHELTDHEYIEREMVLIKVRAKPENRAEILRIVDIFRSKVVDVGRQHYTIEVTGDEGKLEAILTLLKPIGIKEVARTGLIALYREPK
jgi:acetolactate synthase-1/3 small subunit